MQSVKKVGGRGGGIHTLGRGQTGKGPAQEDVRISGKGKASHVIQ